MGGTSKLKLGAIALAKDEGIFFCCSKQLYSEFEKAMGIRGEYKTKASFFRAKMIDYIKETRATEPSVRMPMEAKP